MILSLVLSEPVSIVIVSRSFADITLPTIKKKCIEHILLFGNAKENIYNIEESDTIENIIYELQTWCFEQFLMYHREQLVNISQ